ncbi:MAG: hypothetical protein ACYTFG_12870, partial [Planctomycetota bacterium]
MQIRRTFPSLSRELDEDPRNIDLEMRIHEQAGAVFEIGPDRQGEEMHLTAGAFWLEWFPCRRESVSSAFFGAVTGLLFGRMRILEDYRGKRAVKAE